MQCKFTLMYIAPLSTRTLPLLTSLQNKTTSHKSRQGTPHHYTSHHFTYLHSIPTWIPLLATTFLTLFLNVFSLQGRDASKLAVNWFQLLMVLFTRCSPEVMHKFLLWLYKSCCCNPAGGGRSGWPWAWREPPVSLQGPVHADSNVVSVSDYLFVYW